MLILTRYTGQSIMIGDDIKVVVIKEDNGRITLGVNAPSTVSIHREEIYNKIADQKPKITYIKDGKKSSELAHEQG